MSRCQHFMSVIAATLAAMVLGGGAQAEQSAANFPSQTITIVVPFGAGGPPDTIARVVASGLSEALGTPVIVENRTGASSAVAAAAVARAPADGHTLLAVDISFAVAPHVVANFSVDTLKDFKPVGQSARSSFVLIASSALEAQTIGEFIALTKKREEEVKIGHSGIGTTPHLAAMTFINSAKIKPLLVSYRRITEATTNVISGHISGVFSAASMAIGLANDKRVRVLAITGDARSPALPDVPTFAESNIQMVGFEGGSWYGLVAPAKTPDAVVAKINAALKKAAGNKKAQAQLAKSGVEFVSDTPQEFGAFIAKQNQFWGETLKASGITPDSVR